ncbi:MAG TPA: hypothetical protein ENN45_01455, partial [Bacteroidetes bacterium]|nr:hypothetical protein [Bacteroidota bacterium]
MNLFRGTGITLLIVFISLLLIGMTVVSVVTEETTETTTDYDFEEMANQILNEITSYIQIKDQKGKFSGINGEQRIQKIAILISPLISQNIDLSKMTIQLNDGEIVKILAYGGNSENLNSQSIFEHALWDKINGDNFGFITICD